MKNHKRAIWVSICGALALLYLLHWIFPIMECNDGCECGYKRIWYECPNSPFHHKGFFLRIENPGDPLHEHRLWDATWGVWMKLPWQK
jgi:hypothetical protein